MYNRNVLLSLAHDPPDFPPVSSSYPSQSTGLSMKKPYLLIAAALVCILGLPLLLSGTPDRGLDPAPGLGLNTIEPAAGGSSMSSAIAAESGKPATAAIPAETTASEIVPSPQDRELSSAVLSAGDAPEEPPLRISSDKPEIIQLDREAVNILVGSDKHLRAVPDTNRSIVLIPKLPGSTYFRALDADGKVIMQRHVIVGSPVSNYIRIRRACVNGDKDCRQYSVYYCPDMCHEINVAGQEDEPSPAAPDQAPSVPNQDSGRIDGATGPDAVDAAPEGTPQ